MQKGGGMWRGGGRVDKVLPLEIMIRLYDAENRSMMNTKFLGMMLTLLGICRECWSSAIACTNPRAIHSHFYTGTSLLHHRIRPIERQRFRKVWVAYFLLILCWSPKYIAQISRILGPWSSVLLLFDTIEGGQIAIRWWSTEAAPFYLICWKFELHPWLAIFYICIHDA